MRYITINVFLCVIIFGSFAFTQKMKLAREDYGMRMPKVATADRDEKLNLGRRNVVFVSHDEHAQFERYQLHYYLAILVRIMAAIILIPRIKQKSDPTWKPSWTRWFRIKD